MRRNPVTLVIVMISMLLIPITTLALGSNQKKVDWILKMDTAPFGVIFEVVEGDGSALNWAIPQIKDFSAQLRKRFPDIGIAVVSHGREQFALTKDKAKKFSKVHNLVKSLSLNDDIPVHVCGTHASWFNKSATDFPDYIKVSPAAPTEIANYEEMGYELIVMDAP